MSQPAKAGWFCPHVTMILIFTPILWAVLLYYMLVR